MTFQLKTVLLTRENLLISAFLCGLFLFQSGLLSVNGLGMGTWENTVMAQDADDEDVGDEAWDDEEEATDDAVDEESWDDEENTDEDMEDSENSKDSGDEEASEDDGWDDEDSEDSGDDDDSGDADEVDGNQNAEMDIMLEQYKSDALYATKKYEYGDASIREILASNPTTVMELVSAARDFTALKRYELANMFYKLALEAEPTEDDVTALVTEYGRAFFVTLSENELLDPSGKAFGKAILTALENRFSSDPEFIQQMIEQLFSTDENERKVAETELMTYRSVSLPALINAYMERLEEAEDGEDTEENPELQVLQQTLLMFGEGLTSAAAACLESEEVALQKTAVNLLTIQAKHTTPEAVMMLFYATARGGENAKEIQSVAMNALKKLAKCDVGRAHLARFLETQIEKLQSDKKRIEVAGNDNVIEVIWRWNADEKVIFPSTASRLTKYRLNSYRLAQAYWNLFPLGRKARKYQFMTASEYVTTFMDEFVETELKTNQIMRTEEFQHLLKNYRLEEIEGYLTECLQSRFYDAAVFAVLAMGELGDETLLQPVGARAGKKLDPTLCVAGSESYSPLVCALHVPNRLLRFAALQTVMKMNPQKAFPGSSRVIDTLAWFLSTDGHSKVLVGDLTEADAVRLGGRLRQHGFAFEMAASSKSILEKAIQYCDFTMILMNVKVLMTNSDLLLQQLALDPRTADIPVVLLAEPEDYKTAEQWARRLPKAVWFPEPASETDLKLMLTLVSHIQTSVTVSDEQRVVETRTVLLWARDIMRSHQSGWKQKLRFNVETWNNPDTPIWARDMIRPLQEGMEEPIPAAEMAQVSDVEKDAENVAEDEEEVTEEAEDTEMEETNVDSTGDSELDALLAEGGKLPDAKELKTESPAEVIARLRAQATEQWDREPLAVYDVTRLLPPVMKIYFYPEFLKEALEVLRWTGTPEAQQSLAFIGTSGTFSYSASVRAARVFRENTLRFGILLTKKQVGDLYDLYNNTPAKRERLLEVRGLVLDALEAPLNPKAIPDVTLDIVEEETEEVTDETADETAEDTEAVDEEEVDDSEYEDEEEVTDEEEDYEEELETDDVNEEDFEEELEGDELESDDAEIAEEDELSDEEGEELPEEADDAEIADEAEVADNAENAQPAVKNAEQEVELDDAELDALDAALDEEMEAL